MQTKVFQLRAIVPTRLAAHLIHETSSLSDDESALLIDECLKFLFLASKKVQTSTTFYIPVSSAIDEIWHACILQTKSYGELCLNLPGQGFIHHSSDHFGYEKYAEQVGSDAIAAETLWWLEHYCVWFGRFTEQAAPHWNIVAFLMTEFSLSLDEVNAVGAGHVIEKIV